MEKRFAGVASNGINWHQIDDFLPDFAVVKADNEHLYNYIDENGNLLSEEWFWMVGYMFEADGMAVVVRLDNETGVKTRNFIDTQGHIVMPKWTTHYPYEHKNGITFVADRHGPSIPWWRGFNFLDEQGNLISPWWFERAVLTDEYDGYIGVVDAGDRGCFLLDNLGYFTPLKAFSSDSNEVKKYRFDELPIYGMLSSVC